jgi:hypothetical protein
MITLSPSELFARSKKKFELALARLRREQIELALLSLHGSLEDAFRAHLALHQNMASEGDWGDVLAALQQDVDEPLARHEVDRIRRNIHLHERIAQGEAVTLTKESITAYKEFTVELLRRYGVTVAISEESASRVSIPASLQRPDDELLDRLTGVGRRGLPWYQRQPKWLLLAAGLIIMLSVGVTLLVVQQFRSAPATRKGPVLPGATTVLGTPLPSPTPTPTEVLGQVLTQGSRATVREEVVGGLALRTRPSTSEDVPVQVYLDPGVEVEVVEGPVDADGYTWWKVRAGDEEGWCAGEFLEVLER